jgi:hypothetical protein
VLQPVLEEYFLKFDGDQFDFSLSGKVEIKNLIVKPDKINEIFNKAKAPISLKAGLIALVKIQVSVNFKVFLINLFI